VTDIFYETVIDTAIVVDALVGRKEAAEELRRVARPSISRVTWLEVMAGAPSDARAETEYFLARFLTREITGDVARRAADLRHHRPTLSLCDALVFATAQEHGAILVTRNTKDFPAQMPGIRVPYTL
jgi:predicted nucleic acid-binding protein